MRAAVALQDHLRTAGTAVDCPPGLIDGEVGNGNLIDGGQTVILAVV